MPNIIMPQMPPLTVAQKMRGALAGVLSGRAPAVSGLTGKGTDNGHRPKHVYAGTVPGHVIAKRRRRAKQARMSRRVNR